MVLSILELINLKIELKYKLSVGYDDLNELQDEGIESQIEQHPK